MSFTLVNRISLNYLTPERKNVAKTLTFRTSLNRKPAQTKHIDLNLTFNRQSD